MTNVELHSTITVEGDSGRKLDLEPGIYQATTGQYDAGPGQMMELVIDGRTWYVPNTFSWTNAFTVLG